MASVVEPRTAAWEERRGRIEEYFDRRAHTIWARITTDAPMGRIRTTVREGRNAMRAHLLSWLPRDLTGLRILDAGCGPGQVSIELARRGADVVAVDLSAKLIDLAVARIPDELRGRVHFVAGDMLRDFGMFDHVFAMDSLIHYETPQMVDALGVLASRTRRSILFTFPPRPLWLGVMHGIGRLFPRGTRAPSIEPVPEARLRTRVAAQLPPDWRWHDTHRVHAGFYVSQAVRLERAG